MALAVACNGSSSSSPTAPPASAPEFILDFSAVGFTAGEQQAIRAVVADVWERSSDALPLRTVTFFVSVDAARTIPGWGVGGYTVSPSDIELVFDPRAGGIADVARESLPIVVAHEVHHTARILAVGYATTLLETLVFEGMADAFAVELLGHEPPPWASALSDAELDRWQRAAEPLYDDMGFSFEQWFFGFGEQPRWTGYSLGFELIQRYLASNPGRTAASLIREPANSFR